ncbi:MAG: gamma-glutamyltransferase [Spirochaetales bacterium]|nr:gamma-glutamyltransferase [Spirochaetales bacterium]
MKKLMLCLLILVVLSTAVWAGGQSEALPDVQTFSVNPDNPAIARADVARKGMVVSGKPVASQIGAAILEKGGNAIDAAVATAFAVGVFEPNASGIGGGGFMTIYLAEEDRVVVVDFRETSPANASNEMFYRFFKEDKSFDFYGAAFSPQAIGVPGEVLGLETALEKYGTMTMEEVVTPVYEELEANGIEVTGNLAGIIADMYRILSLNEGSADLWLNEDGMPYQVGDVIYNPDLVKTLKAIAKEGAKAIYEGPIAEAIVENVQALGGVLSLEDLAGYKVEIREPIVGEYRGYEIVSIPPASSGGTHIVQLLNILENFDLGSYEHGSTEAVHLWAEAMKFVYADRSKYMADTAFVDVPLSGLVSEEYAKILADKISMESVLTELDQPDVWPYESSSTTHLSVMDGDGNVVSLTKSINFFFGSGVTVPGTGIIMNNHMMDFDLTPGSVNGIEAGKRPLSSMSPSLVLKDGSPFMVIGSPGGSNIIVAVAQVISNVVDYDMSIIDAVDALRLVSKLGAGITIEGRISDDTVKALQALGHEVSVKDSYYPSLGSVNSILIDETGVIVGVGDPRRDGQAVGVK